MLPTTLATSHNASHQEDTMSQATHAFKSIYALALGLGLLACVGSSHAEDFTQQQTVYGSISPFGVGVGWGHRINEHWSNRIYLNSGTLGHPTSHGDLNDNRYALTWKASPSLAAMTDYFPWADSGWRLSAGLITANSHLDIKGQPNAQGQYTLNHHSYTAAQVGELKGRLKHGPLNLYMGGGWESAGAGDKGWRFVSDIGIFYAGRASSTLEASGAAGNAALQADLEAERRSLRKQGFGAAVSLGAGYSF